MSESAGHEAAWTCVDLGDAITAEHNLDILQKNLNDTYESAGRPAGMAAFYRYDSNDLHCHIRLYLSTDFQRAIALRNGHCCAAPRFKDLIFLAGNKNMLS